MYLFDELKERNLLFACSDESLRDAMENEHLTFYLGADPTGSSLHVGHLVTYLVARRLAMHGHNPILLIGGATGLIGDPKQQGERKMLELSDTLANCESLKKQVENIFGFKNIVNNYDWISKIDIITFLRDYGKFFNVNNMINKETVKARLESGISYTEFSYQILQGLDWHHLYVNNNCKLQIGGQDQWGNMVSGLDLIRKKVGPEEVAYTMTIPLILKSDGTKFGKSEGGQSVWLDKNRTSPYEFYQFWINTPDSDVIMRLKQFTFLSLEEIKAIEEKWALEPHLRLAQKTLAFEITKFVHGEEDAKEAIRISEALFSGDIKNLSAKEIEMGFGDLPRIKAVDENIVDVLIATGLAQSKREAREFVANGATSINGEKMTDLEFVVSKEKAIEGKYIVIRRGKKKYALIEF